MNDLRKNGEGYSDPTAYAAISSVIAEEKRLQQRANDLIQVLKYIILVSDFELINRIEIKDIKTGRIFK